MSFATFKPGELYAARTQVRSKYHEFRKGILFREGHVAIIVAYRGLARRIHYEDRLAFDPLHLVYVGEGREGDQKLTRGNAALVEAARSGSPVTVFFDCGDIQLPSGSEKKFEKHFVSGGAWHVGSARYGWSRAENRRVWRFVLEPADEETRLTVEAIFAGEALQSFETLLGRFAKVRRQLYEGYEHVLRARDSIAGQVGEYFAVQGFNRRFPELPLVRVRSNFPDLDAVQTKTGRRFAVKTVTGIPQNTSNIWSPLDELRDRIDDFLVVHLDPFDLVPKSLYRLPAARAPDFWSKDNYQGSGKLKIDVRFQRIAREL
jgi:hypothetical protein